MLLIYSFACFCRRYSHTLCIICRLDHNNTDRILSLIIRFLPKQTLERSGFSLFWTILLFFTTWNVDLKDLVRKHHKKDGFGSKDTTKKTDLARKHRKSRLYSDISVKILKMKRKTPLLFDFAWKNHFNHSPCVVRSV